MYCYKCRWHKCVGVKKTNNSDCKVSSSYCDCSHLIYKCEYMNYIDFNQDSLLWDSCKECGVKDK